MSRGGDWETEVVGGTASALDAIASALGGFSGA